MQRKQIHIAKTHRLFDAFTLRLELHERVGRLT
jgi:hypothetical protein